MVLVDPAAELLEGCRGPPELLSEGDQQQQHVGKKEEGKLEEGWEQSAGIRKNKN